MKLYDSKEYLVRELKTKTIIQVASENGISSRTICRKLSKFGLTKKVHPWTKNEIKLLKREYPTNPDVFKLFPNRTYSSITHKASKLQLNRIKHTGKYVANSNFFKTWSPSSAYLLGWFFSDGYVTKDARTCGFHINSKDIEILKKIKDCLNATHPIKIHGNYAQFRMRNKMMCMDLIKLGCIPNKSLKLKFPNVSNKFLNHFIRGYFDGDGSIFLNYPNTIKVNFLGTKFFINSLQRKLKEVLELKIHKKRRYDKIWACNYYGNDARKLCFWMYSDAGNLFLKRKKDIFDKHIKLRSMKKSKINHYKQVIIVRTDLKMSKGKLIAQCTHASLGAYKKSDKKIIKKWESGGQKKVVLEVDSKKKILDLYKKLKKEKIPCFLVEDAGLTELKPGTITALGIGPGREETLDKVTGKLKLF